MVLTYCLAWLSFHRVESWFPDLKLYLAPIFHKDKPDEICEAGAVPTLRPEPSVNGGPAKPGRGLSDETTSSVE
jgi:hypothetical protein